MTRGWRSGRLIWRPDSGGRSPDSGLEGRMVRLGWVCRGPGTDRSPGPKIELATDAVVRTASAEDHSAGQRLYGQCCWRVVVDLR